MSRTTIAFLTLVFLLSCGSDDAAVHEMSDGTGDESAEQESEVISTNEENAVPGASSMDSGEDQPSTSCAENYCPHPTVCVGGRCILPCEHRADCDSDEICRFNADDEPTCVEAWECEQLTGEGVWQSNAGVCSAGWLCGDRTYEVACETHDDDDRVTCTCVVDGKEGESFEWTAAICSFDDGTRELLNSRCEWALPALPP